MKYLIEVEIEEGQDNAGADWPPSVERLANDMSVALTDEEDDGLEWYYTDVRPVRGPL